MEVPTGYSELLRWAIRATAGATADPAIEARALAITIALARPHVPLSNDPRVGHALAMAETILMGGHGDAEEASNDAFDAEQAAPTKLLAWVASIAGHTAEVAAGYVGGLADAIEDAVELAKERDALTEAEAIARVRGIIIAALGS